MKSERLAAIDIGTNSIRCIVVEADGVNPFKILTDEKATVRLGERIARDNLVSPEAWSRAMTALARMKKVVDGYGVRWVEAVATSAMRRAANGELFVKAVADEIGLEISVISGEEEAELVTLSALNSFDMAGARYAMADIGGGSVEVVTAFGCHIKALRSLELGAVVLTEMFGTSDLVGKEDYLRLRKHVRKTLKTAGIDKPPPSPVMIGSGGAMTAIAAMVMAMRKEEYISAHGYEILRFEIVHLLAMLLRKDLKGRKGIPGLNPERADIIVAGVAVVDQLMELLGANTLRINERGLREGIILKALRKHNLSREARSPRTWREAALEFARSCHFDEDHSQQVARLSLELFDALAAFFGLTDKDRQMLETAALLHDIGYLIGYSGHHKHSYHLIRHADLFGFPPREHEIIANIARYHRKSLPAKKHESYARLSARDRALVEKLGGILRLADGLDRRRVSAVTSLECMLSSTTFRISLYGPDDVSVEIFGGKQKGDLFETAFARKLMLSPGVVAKMPASA